MKESHFRRMRSNFGEVWAKLDEKILQTLLFWCLKSVDHLKGIKMPIQSKNLTHIGIIGGGQLSLMLADALFRMGFKPIVLSENPHTPAAQAYPLGVYGATDDESALEKLFAQVSCVIFENEFVNCEKLRTVASKNSVHFFPSLDTLASLQDKLRQKVLLEKLKIPSASYLVLNSTDDIHLRLLSILKHYGGHCVLKWAKMGYDGKGVLEISDSPEDIKRAEEFCAKASRWGSSVYAEEKVLFKRELALIAVLSRGGEFLSYPLVISEQKKGICVRVYGPATAFGVSQKNEERAKQYAERISKSIELVGAFGIEFFETQSGELWVNEIAPRVHNSGHYTQNACATDQFENHCRAILEIPLGEISSSAAFAMLNLLGPDHFIGMNSREFLPEPTSRLHLHWYSKNEIRPRRKLGHLNGTVQSFNDIDILLKDLDDCHQRWLQCF